MRVEIFAVLTDLADFLLLSLFFLLEYSTDVQFYFLTILVFFFQLAPYGVLGEPLSLEH